MADPNYGNGSSVARDLGEQYRDLFKTEQLDLTHPSGDVTVPALVVADGRTLASVKHLFDEYLPKPDRRRGTAQLTDVASFVAHITRFKNEASEVFANPSREKPALVAVYDYHPAGPDSTDADWLQHRAVYAPQLSPAWKEWSARNGMPMSQADFAAFIEDHITDVVVVNLDEPKITAFANLVQGRYAEPSELMALSRGLELNVETSVKNAVTLSTGEISVRYDEQHKDGAGQPIQIGNLFQIRIPVFYGGADYMMAVRLRYKQSGGRIMWHYLIVRPDRVFDDAFKGIVTKVAADAEVPVLLGAPES